MGEELISELFLPGHLGEFIQAKPLLRGLFPIYVSTRACPSTSRHEFAHSTPLSSSPFGLCPGLSSCIFCHQLFALLSSRWQQRREKYKVLLWLQRSKRMRIKRKKEKGKIKTKMGEGREDLKRVLLSLSSPLLQIVMFLTRGY